MYAINLKRVRCQTDMINGFLKLKPAKKTKKKLFVSVPRAISAHVRVVNRLSAAELYMGQMMRRAHKNLSKSP